MSLADRIGVNRIVLGISIGRMADALGNSILIVTLPLYVAELPSPGFEGVPDSVLVGVLISLYGIVFSGLQPFTGALSDWADRRKPFIVGGLLMMGAGTASFLFARQFSHLILIRFFQGLGVAVTVPSALALMASSTQKSTRGGSMGVYSALRMLGFAIGPLVGGWLYVTFGFDSVFLVGAGAVMVGVVLVQLWVDETEDSNRRAGQVRSVRLFDPEIFTRDLLALGTATFLMAIAFSMITTLENEFNARLQQTALGFGIAFSALTFSRLLFQVPLGRLSDRVGRKPVIIAGLILMAPATGLLGFVLSTIQLTGLRALQGLASAAIAAPAFALAGDLSKTGGEGQQMSMLAMGFGLGIAVGPLIAGVLAVVSFQLPFVIGAVLSLFGAWVVHTYVPETIWLGPEQA